MIWINYLQVIQRAGKLYLYASWKIQVSKEIERKDITNFFKLLAKQVKNIMWSNFSISYESTDTIRSVGNSKSIKIHLPSFQRLVHLFYEYLLWVNRNQLP